MKSFGIIQNIRAMLQALHSKNLNNACSVIIIIIDQEMSKDHYSQFLCRTIGFKMNEIKKKSISNQ